MTGLEKFLHYLKTSQQDLVFANPHLEKVAEEYEADILNEKKKQKWDSLERVEKYLNEYLDMPTARALTRYVFKSGQLKDDQIRGLADIIDSIRKPLELIFTEKPEAGRQPRVAKNNPRARTVPDSKKR